MPVSAPGLINLTSVRDGRLRTNIRKLAVLDEAVAAFNPTKRIKGKTLRTSSVPGVRQI